ncbi:PilZ domain-containing protein [Thermodesulfobacteriota bacterium]
MTECPNCGQKCQPDDTECSQCGTDFNYLKIKISEEEAAVASKQQERTRLTTRLSELIKEMSEGQLASLVESAEEITGIKKRLHKRVSCLITADCLHQSRASNNYIKDIGFGGVFIETSEPFALGDEITLTLSLSHHVKPFKITGTVVRSVPDGVGVQFKTMSQVQDMLIKGMVEKVEELKK